MGVGEGRKGCAHVHVKEKRLWRGVGGVGGLRACDWGGEGVRACARARDGTFAHVQGEGEAAGCVHVRSRGRGGLCAHVRENGKGSARACA